MGKKNYNGDFRQIIFNIVIIGFFSIAKEWVTAHDSGAWLVGIIFTFLTMLMFCLLAINIYNCFTRGNESAGPNDDRQIQALLYKQMKRLEDQMQEIIARHSGQVSEEKIEHMFEEEKRNQLRSAKAILNKMDEIQAKQDKLMKLYEQVEAQLSKEAAVNAFSGEALTEESTSEEPTADIRMAEENPAADIRMAEESPTAGIRMAEESPAADIRMAEESPTADIRMAVDSVMDESFGGLLSEGAMDEPNRELTPDEIAALFAGVD